MTQTLVTASAPARKGRRQQVRGLGSISRRVVLASAIVVVWQLIATVTRAPKLILPTPVDVAHALVSVVSDGSIFGYTAATLKTLGIGTGIGFVVGLGLAVLSVISRWMDELLRLVVSIMNPLPSVALLPLAIIWFGLTPTAIIVVILNSTIWPIALNSSMGFRMISPTLLRAARTLGMSGGKLVTRVMLPASLPYLLTGLRIAWAFGWRTVVGAELIFGAAGGTGGLGYFINQSRYFLETDKVFAGLIVISILGLIVELVFSAIERRTIERWGMTRSRG